MTVLVGVLCDDGAVLGADREVTYDTDGRKIAAAPTCKLRVYDGARMCLATAGSISGGDLAYDALAPLAMAGAADGLDHGSFQAAIGSPLSKIPNPYVASILAANATPTPEYSARTARTYLGNGIVLRALGKRGAERPAVAGYSGSHFGFCLRPDPAKPWHATTGSGEVFADPFMIMIRNVLFPKRLPKVWEAALAVFWALRWTTEARAGGFVGQGIDLAVLQKNEGGLWRVRALLHDDDDAQEEVRKGYDDLISDIRTRFQKAPALPAPPDAANPPPPAPAAS